MKTADDYLKENMAIVGEAQPYATEGGEPPTGMPRNIEEYTPPQRFLKPDNLIALQAELADGTYRLYGTPFTHARQQWYAIQHGRDSMGFDTRPVQFLVHWNYIAPTLFTVDEKGWRQG